MKTITWTCWLLAMCICLSEARHKLRRPLAPLPHGPPIFKKSWPIGPRISMGNTIHIGGAFPHKRMSPYKPPNYRIRRPPMFNVLPTAWKNPMPVLGILNNHGVLPQRPPVKEFHTMNQVPEYSPEYRPEAMILPPTHRGGVDDDKGPIHTIPAPNLSPADKPYNPDVNSGQQTVTQNQYANDLNYNLNLQTDTLANEYGLATIGTSLAPQRTVTSPTPTQHQYEVTEGNNLVQEYHTAQPTYFTPEFDVTRLATVVNPDLQTNEVFLNHPPISNTGLGNIQFGQTNAPMQTNLHSSLHVGFPGTAAQASNMIGNQIPDLHVGHPAPAGPPLSATQLYDLLNSFPQKLTEQYTAGQQPQLQQHLLQQHLGQLLQPTDVTSFSQPQMHSFNYDEQDNQQQQQQQQQIHQEQQQILLDQNFASGRVTADYNLEAEPSNVQTNIQQTDLQSDEELSYTAEVPIEQTENNIDYEETNNQAGQSTYFNKIANNGALSTQFYSSLPSREAAEKLAALAAAGNVNSQLIGQLRKQQQEKQRQSETMPANHKDDSYQDGQDQQQQHYESQYEQEHQQYHQQQRIHQDQAENERRDKHRLMQQQQQQHRRRQNQQSFNKEKRPLRIMVPDDEEYVNDSDSQSEETEHVEYEYDSDEGETTDSRTASSDDRPVYEQNSKSEFGTRLRSKTGK